MVEHMLRLVVYRADAHGLVLPVAEGVAQTCVCHRGHDGVRVGVAVSGDVYFIHLPYLLPYGVLEQCTMIILESTAEFKLICAIFTNL